MAFEKVKKTRNGAESGLRLAKNTQDPFATADGWLVLAVGNDGQWQNFCKAADRPELGRDARFTTNALRGPWM